MIKNEHRNVNIKNDLGGKGPWVEHVCPAALEATVWIEVWLASKSVL